MVGTEERQLAADLLDGRQQLVQFDPESDGGASQQESATPG